MLSAARVSTPKTEIRVFIPSPPRPSQQLPMIPPCPCGASARQRGSAAALRRARAAAYTRFVTGGTQMKTTCWSAAALALCATTVNAQDLTITNGRIVDGTGRVIDRGSVVIRGGKIASVAPGAPTAAAGRRLDAGGKTVMPGLIDAHRH